MKQLTQNMKSGEVKIENVPPPVLFNNGVLVKNYYSLISVGTEKTSIDMGKKSLIQKAKSRPEDVKKVIQEMRQQGIWATYKKVMNKLDLPKSLGYSSAGIVLAVDAGVENFKPGDRVACAGAGYAVHADIVVLPKSLCVKIPDSVSFQDAAYTTVGSIAMQGIRQANPTLGETIVVIGLGLIGQLTVQMLKANGCNVIGIDIDEKSVDIALKSGADIGIIRNKQDVKNIILENTDGYGADSVIITAGTSSNDPVELAGEIARDRARVIMVGQVGMNIPRTPYYLKELEFKLSRSYGPGRYDYTFEEGGIDYPIGHVRWTETRNMDSFLKLICQKKIILKDITTHTFNIDNADKAYDLISGEKKAPRQASGLALIENEAEASLDEFYLGILLKYDELTEKSKTEIFEKIPVNTEAGKESKAINIGFIGVGGHAQSFLLPHLVENDSKLVGICDSQGMVAKHIAEKYKVEFCTSNPDDLINNEKINTIFIATRHGSHFDLVYKSLKNNKNIFVEKPLTITSDELDKIIELYEEKVKTGIRPNIIVGYNRRFSPLMKSIKNHFKDVSEPLIVNYRVNAGFIPKNHWVQDPIEGGGRIVGEVCHFIDIVQYLTGSNPVSVFAQSISTENQKVTPNDNITITIKMQNGSLGIITYHANGDKAVSKERMEVTGGNYYAILDNYESAALYKNEHKTVIKSSGVDKGHKDEVKAYLDSIRTKSSLIDFESLIATSRTVFRILESLNSVEVEKI